jgi:hypothetical protein
MNEPQARDQNDSKGIEQDLLFSFALPHLNLCLAYNHFAGG